MLKVVLFQPDIANNVGAIIRSCVAFDCELHIVEPCGFVFDLNKIKKTALDYLASAVIIRHKSFDIFFNEEIVKKNQRLVLATTKGDISYRKFSFNVNDFIMFGRESCGVSEDVFNKANHKIFIPTSSKVRSLNIANACSIIVAHAVSSFNP
ncbi:tRNA (cytidine(34)-2'-O)-methyltransferase [Alphaproteobacteria bacterium]|nr:tRNA (cytidine(34)-2'-O)-methyltransferase [Alphaproteobacteria bacterium]